MSDAITAHPTLSLLWPPGAGAGAPVALDAAARRDIGLDPLLRRLIGDGRSRGDVTGALSWITRDSAVIRYRQAILADLLAQPALVARLAELLPTIESFSLHYDWGDRKALPTLYEVTWRVGELEGIVEVVQGLNAVFAADDAALESAGLQALRARMAAVAADGTFQSLAAALPELLAQVRTRRSVTIGVNLDEKLMPVEAVLLDISDAPFVDAGLLSRLFGQQPDGSGLAPVHRSAARRGPGPGVPATGSRSTKPLMEPLFRDLADVLERAAKPIARTLGRYVKIQSDFLAQLRQDISFYLAAVRLVRELEENGLPTCRPEIAADDARITRVTGGYNVNLALSHIDAGRADEVITSDILLDDDARIHIVTGPNQGGKTTYLQAVALTQVMAQLGVYVPGKAARIAPVDGVYTHFPVEEQLERGTGRFGDEAQRLGALFNRMTRHSLLLLNESLTSTSASEGLYLARDLLRVLRQLGPRALYATHWHELAEGVAELNAEPGESQLLSLVASRIGPEGSPTARSFRIVPGPPLGRSYARELAARYGVDYEQLLTQLRQRGAFD